jgi:hypothetical protein
LFFLIASDIFASVEKKSKQLWFVFIFQVLLCKRFQVNVLGILMNHKKDMQTVSDKYYLEDDLEFDYLLLPSIAIEETPSVDWITINSIHPSIDKYLRHEANIWTEKGLVCPCIL